MIDDYKRLHNSIKYYREQRFNIALTYVLSE